MNLIECLELKLPLQVALVGAGGKTTALFQLARQVNGLAWVTTTTHLGKCQSELADKQFEVNSNAEIVLSKLIAQKVTLITGSSTVHDRLGPPTSEILWILHENAASEKISLFIEADGSRCLPVKAPGEHEPVIPVWVDLVMNVVGLSALGKPFNPQWVFRPEYFSQITNLKEGDLITIESLADLMVHPNGGFKGIPSQSQKVALLNQVDTPDILVQARSIVPKLLEGGYQKVIVGSLAKAPNDLIVF